MRIMLRRQPESRAMNGRFRGSAARVCSLAMTLHRSVRRQGARGSLHAFSSVQIASPWGGCHKGPRAGRLTSWRQQPHHMCSHARVLCSPFAHPPDRCRRRPYSPPLPEPRSQEFVGLPLPANAGTLFNFLPRSQQLSSLNCVCAHCFLSFRAGAMAAACRRQADAKVSRKALDQTAVSRLA